MVDFHVCARQLQHERKVVNEEKSGRNEDLWIFSRRGRNWTYFCRIEIKSDEESCFVNKST